MGLTSEQSRFDSQEKQETYLSSTATRPVMEPRHIPIQWAPASLALAYSGRAVNLTTHLNLVSSLRTSGAIPPFPNTCP